MARRPGAGHKGAQGRKHRCKECGHRPGPRAVTIRKRSCSHSCHQAVK